MHKLKQMSSYLLMQLLVENLDETKPKKRIKQLTNQLIKEIEPQLKNYNKLFSLDESMTQSLSFELENLVKQLATAGLSELISVSQHLEAYGINREKVEKSNHSIIKRGK